MKTDGSVDCTMTIADVCQQLGLHGDGIGQFVGVRSHKVLLEKGFAGIASKVKIIAFNPPEVTIIVEGEIYQDGGTKKQIKIVTCGIDDLVQLEAQEETKGKPGPLQLGCEPHMPRVPKLDLVDHMRSMMADYLRSTAAAFVVASAAWVEDKVEVVYIPECGQEKGHGVMQCRVKKHITAGALRLYPYGGQFLHVEDDVGRKAIEKGFSLKPCYIRGISVKAKVVNAARLWVENYILYSAMSHKSSPLTTVGPDDTVQCTRHFSPFWAVMLVGRDTSHMVNMIPYVEEYIVPQAQPKHHGKMTVGNQVMVEMPFLSNRCALKPGDLLALPFDGGHAAFSCEEFPKIVK